MSDKFEELRTTTDNLVDDIEQQVLKKIVVVHLHVMELLVVIMQTGNSMKALGLVFKWEIVEKLLNKLVV